MEFQSDGLLSETPSICYCECCVDSHNKSKFNKMQNIDIIHTENFYLNILKLN